MHVSVPALRGQMRETARRRVVASTMATEQEPDVIEPGEPRAGSEPALDGRGETELQRYDRNLNEILGELRVALPGVQVLFAFLLVAPFNQRFGTVTSFERRLYFATLLCTLLASILLIAPTLVHRLTFRLGQKAYVVQTANRLMIAGLSVFALAMTCAVLLVTHYLYGESTAIVTTAIAALAIVAIWFAIPLQRRRAWRRHGG
jgi:hypothetical protein